MLLSSRCTFYYVYNVKYFPYKDHTENYFCIRFYSKDLLIYYLIIVHSLNFFDEIKNKTKKMNKNSKKLLKSSYHVEFLWNIMNCTMYHMNINAIKPKVDNL